MICAVQERTDELELIVESTDDARLVVRRLLSVTEAGFERRAQLEQALQSRLVIEQAKGVLAERHQLEIEDAFDVLRRGARSSRRKIHDLAREVVSSRDTPSTVLDELQRRIP
jgi:AmiR/NasT family two-component response regulator